MSALNYSEVIASQVRKGEDLLVAIRLVDDLDLPIIPWDEHLAREASDLASLGWTHGLSLGDRACLATARRLDRVVLTAERKWPGLRLPGIQIELIR